jgi:hypothetical protein
MAIHIYCPCSLCSFRGPEAAASKATPELSARAHERAAAVGMRALDPVSAPNRTREPSWLCAACFEEVVELATATAAAPENSDPNDGFDVWCLLCAFNRAGTLQRSRRVSEAHARTAGWVYVPEIRAVDPAVSRVRPPNWICRPCLDDIVLVHIAQQEELPEGAPGRRLSLQPLPDTWADREQGRELILGPAAERLLRSVFVASWRTRATPAEASELLAVIRHATGSEHPAAWLANEALARGLFGLTFEDVVRTALWHAARRDVPTTIESRRAFVAVAFACEVARLGWRGSSRPHELAWAKATRETVRNLEAFPALGPPEPDPPPAWDDDVRAPGPFTVDLLGESHGR